MTNPILALRVSRRAIAGVVVADEQLAFFDGRHLRSRPDAALTAAQRYTRLLLSQVQPRQVVIDCAVKEGSSTQRLLTAILGTCAESRAAVEHLDVDEILCAFGLKTVPTRRELQMLVEPFFSEFAGIKGQVKPYLVDAAAAALVAECRSALGKPSA